MTSKLMSCMHSRLEAYHNYASDRTALWVFDVTGKCRQNSPPETMQITKCNHKIPCVPPNLSSLDSFTQKGQPKCPVHLEATKKNLPQFPKWLQTTTYTTTTLYTLSGNMTYYLRLLCSSRQYKLLPKLPVHRQTIHNTTLIPCTPSDNTQHYPNSLYTFRQYNILPQWPVYIQTTIKYYPDCLYTFRQCKILPYFSLYF